MNKRDFIKTGIAGVIGMIGVPVLADSSRKIAGNSSKAFTLPELPYDYDALEPFMSRETLIFHYTHYHAGFTSKFNSALAQANLKPGKVRILLKQASDHSYDIVYNGGAHLNHKIFWNSLSPKGGGLPTGNLAAAIHKDFGSFEHFKEQFETAAHETPDQGWVWLIRQHNDRLKIVTTLDNQNPCMNTVPENQRGLDLFCLDMGHDAYFPLTSEGKETYIKGFWDFANWERAERRFKKKI